MSCGALQIFSGWVATLFIACGLAAGFTAFGVNSPNRSDVDQIQAAAEAYNTTNTAMLAQLQAASAPGVAVSIFSSRCRSSLLDAEIVSQLEDRSFIATIHLYILVTESALTCFCRTGSSAHCFWPARSSAPVLSFMSMQNLEPTIWDKADIKVD